MVRSDLILTNREELAETSKVEGILKQQAPDSIKRKVWAQQHKDN